mmetsp:Transcript_19158/g.49188  ORF Transcript_19158/g.49188 Transcript_19158/m.49188 type:complete len:91 (-) Transcript_19158:85-357(-)
MAHKVQQELPNVQNFRVGAKVTTSVTQQLRNAQEAESTNHKTFSSMAICAWLMRHKAHGENSAVRCHLAPCGGTLGVLTLVYLSKRTVMC